MTVVRLHDLPEPVLELLMMCLVDAAYDCEHAAKLFRAHFDGNTAAEEFTGDAVRGILREMAHDGMLQFLHAACTPEAQRTPEAKFECFAPPPRRLPAGAPGIDNSTLDEPPAEAPNTWSLDDVMLGKIFENLGRKGSIPAMRASRRFRSVGLAVKNFWQQAVFVEEGTELSSAAERLQKRLGNFVEQHAQQVEEMALRNTAVAPFWKQAAESLLKVENLQRCFTTSCFTALQRLILHSFKSQELHAITSNGRLFPKLERLELFQCWLGAGNFLDLAELPALSSLGIWGLKNTQISLPDRWPSFRLDELCLDPVEATAWPRLGGPRSLQRLHLCTSRPRLALASVPTSLQVLSLTTSAQDLSNPFVEAFVLLDEHVQQLLPSLPQLVDLVLSGHVRLGPCSISCLSSHTNLRRLGLAKCAALDCDEALAVFMASSWRSLEVFEAPGQKHFKLDQLQRSFPHLQVLGLETWPLFSGVEAEVLLKWLPWCPRSGFSRWKSSDQTLGRFQRGKRFKPFQDGSLVICRTVDGPNRC
ncbi:unnamed protein product [Durusdinium trenchii]|uniref:F-box domain-containing protein n=1 Tax=Durusdinium trenchii TaxID=1381693 RepID=A0ABP0QG69_9DINO